MLLFSCIKLLIKKTYGLYKLVQQQFYYTKITILRTLSTWADNFLLAVQVITEAQLRAPLKSLGTMSVRDVWGVLGCPKYVPYDAERR